VCRRHPTIPALLISAAVFALASSTTEGGARAAVLCPAELANGGDGAPLAGLDARVRLTWIDARLGEAGHHARLWDWGWGLGIAASGVASLIAVPFVASGDRIDWYTGAGSAAIGVIPFMVSPLTVARDSRELHARLARAARDPSRQEVCALLLDAETRLVRDAENQRQQQRWYFHAGNVAFNTGVTLFLGLGYHHWTSGLINGIAGAVVGEAIIFTQPTRTIHDLETYRTGSLGDGF